MAFVFVVGQCVFCHRVMSFNPLRVPSIPINGKREPMCINCHTKANEIRVGKGLEPWPEPFPDAYEAVDEREVW